MVVRINGGNREVYNREVFGRFNHSSSCSDYSFNFLGQPYHFKGQKTTEFRQAWIDSLRADVAEFLSLISLFSCHIRVLYPNKANKRDFLEFLLRELSNEMARLDLVHNAILLRLNPKEHGHIVLKLKELKSAFISELVLDVAHMNKLEKELLEAFNKELKNEWGRVKSGEMGFRVTKYMLIILLVLGLLVFGLLLILAIPWEY